MIQVAFRRANPDLGAHSLFAIEDGALMSAVGDLTEAELAYALRSPSRVAVTMSRSICRETSSRSATRSSASR